MTLCEKVARELADPDFEFGKYWRQDEVYLSRADRILALVAERPVGAGYTEAEVRERERKAFVACAAAIMSTTWCLPNGKTTIEWAELEAARRYP